MLSFLTGTSYDTKHGLEHNKDSDLCMIAEEELAADQSSSEISEQHLNPESPKTIEGINPKEGLEKLSQQIEQWQEDIAIHLRKHKYWNLRRADLNS